MGGWLLDDNDEALMFGWDGIGLGDHEGSEFR